MKIAVMQPYLFPYLGYFQLAGAVDLFVILDDVNYIPRGWINRNFILNQGKKQRFTLPLRAASQNSLINQIQIAEKPLKLIELIRHSYRRAPQFSNVFPLIEKILRHPEDNLARLLDFQLRQVCDYLGIHPAWRVASELPIDNDLRAQAKILAIAKWLGATHYINAPGGTTLYDRETFAAEGIRLSFIQSTPVTYRQLDGNFVPDLSIIDVLMFNDKAQCACLLEEYELA